MNANYPVEALVILLDEACLMERYHPLIPYRERLISGFQSLGCKTKDEAAALSDEALMGIGLSDPETVRLLRRFLTLYDPDPKKFREIAKVASDPEEQRAFGELYTLPGVRQARASLYYKAGYRSLSDFAGTSVEEVQKRTRQAITEYHLACIVPLPKEIRTHIAVAKAFLWDSGHR